MKKLLIGIGILLFSIPLLFGAEKEAAYVLRWESGLNSHASPFFVPETQSSQLLNMRVNDEFRALAKRPVMVVYGTPEAKASTGLYRYYKADATKKLIAGSSTFLWVGDDDAGTFAKIGTGFTDGSWWSFANYQDMMIAANGSDQPVKYDGSTSITANTDGHRTAENLVAELGAPFAELNTGTNLDASSWYQYKVAFYDGTTYHYSTARSNPILTGAAVYNIALTDIPLGPEGTTNRYVYRTLGNASRTTVLADTTYYKVATIADNTTTVLADTVTDDVADNDAVPTWTTVSGGSNATPPVGKYALIHRERLFLGRALTAKSTLYYSDVYKPDFFDPDDYFEIRPDDGDEITALAEFLGILTIFKTRTIQKLYTDQTCASGTDCDTLWNTSPPFSFIGSPAPYSVAVTPAGIFYYGREGIWRFTGQSSSLVSDAVTDSIKDILQSNVENISGCYYKNEYHFSYTSSDLGGTANNRVLVYDFVRDAFALDSKNVNTFAKLDSGSDFGVLYMGDSTTTGAIYINEAKPDTLTKKYKSEFDAGTYDDARSAGGYDMSSHPHFPTGTEFDFFIELAWDYTIDTWSGAGATTDNLRDTYTGAITDRPDLDGTWVSPIYRIDASALEKLVWKEDLGPYGNITWQVMNCDDAACSGDSYSTAVTDPSGSDLTGETAQTWIRFRANLTTTNIEYSPHLIVKNGFVVKLYYNKAGSTKESSVLSVYDSGWKNFGIPLYEKYLWRADVFYTGDVGTVNVTYRNIEGDVEKSFDIDLTVDPESVIDDEYIGTQEGKVYRHWSGMNTEDDPSALGQEWRFVLSEDSTNSDFKIHKVEIWYYLEELER